MEFAPAGNDCLAAADPSLRVKTDEESGQTIISGMGGLQLDIILDRMR
ncbi:hypothetical protein, partial [Mesorhizobium sp. M7A.F.Ca.AU.002.02.1.1]